MTKAHWLALAVVIVVVGSLLGQGQLAGLVATAVFLVFIIAVALGRNSLRPASGRSARSINFLANYRSPDSPTTLGGVVVASFAAWTVVEASLPDASLGALIAALAVPTLCFLLSPLYAADGLSIVGVIAAAYLVAQDDRCQLPTSQLGLVMLGSVLVIFVAVNVVVSAATRAVTSLPSVLRRNRSRMGRAVLLFAVVDLALFVARPQGLEIWEEAPGWSPAVVIGLIGVIALFGAYAAPIVSGLLALAMVVAHVGLALAEIGIMGGDVGDCGSPATGLIWAGASSVLISVILRVRSPLRTSGVLGAD